MDDKEVAKYWNENAKAWTILSRMGYDVYRDFFNSPAFLAMLPSIEGQKGLDIGCGEGTNTRRVAKLGAKMIGIDVSEIFIAAAKDTESAEPLGIEYHTAFAQHLPFPNETFDFATSFMCLMDVADLESALKEALRVIKPGGFLQFSICHPCYDTPIRFWVREEDDSKIALAVGGYFNDVDGRILEWIFSSAPPEIKEKYPKFKTPIFHRTVSEWINLLVQTGFTIEELNEPYPTDEAVAACPNVADAQIISDFLHIRCRKPLK